MFKMCRRNGRRVASLFLVCVVVVRIFSGVEPWRRGLPTQGGVNAQSSRTRPHSRAVECDAWTQSYASHNGRNGELVKDETFVSQFHQDWLMYSAFFRQLELNGTRGTYLDIAAAWPRKLSNTYFFDRCQGWEGVCVEGDPAKVRLLQSERSCVVIPTCVAEARKTVIFTASLSTGGAGVKGLAAPIDPSFERSFSPPLLISAAPSSHLVIFLGTHKRTKVHTNKHKDAQANTRTHKETQAHTSTHKHTHAPTSTHKVLPTSTWTTSNSCS
jgi:hypothetical protein